MSGMLIKYDVKTDDVIRTVPHEPSRKKTADKTPSSPAHENKKGNRKKKVKKQFKVRVDMF